MTADYEALEARVAELEQQMRHILPAKMDAMNFGIGILNEDLRALREETSARFDRLEGTLGRHGEQIEGLSTRMDRHGEMLQEILRRLPRGDGSTT